MTIFHIRRPLRKARGNQFYRDRNNRSQGTYCGSPETAYDVSSRRDAVPFNGREPCKCCIACTLLRDAADALDEEVSAAGEETTHPTLKRHSAIADECRKFAHAARYMR